jgi:phosphatidylglycerophosphate synthase
MIDFLDQATDFLASAITLFCIVVWLLGATAPVWAPLLVAAFDVVFSILTFCFNIYERVRRFSDR